MAGLTMWIAAAFALLACFAATCALTLRHDPARALAAAQTASGVLILLIVVLSIWWNESSLLTVALAAVLLAFPGALVMARLLTGQRER